ncbi:MAG TPA: hypothetical protein VFT19_11260, partial [Solirubrobacterales bacterium]|nr:hypothetical protein [Solirubrobacterales bacterium]
MTLLFAMAAQAASAATLKVGGAGTGNGTVTTTVGSPAIDCHITAGVPDEATGEVCETTVPALSGVAVTATED